MSLGGYKIRHQQEVHFITFAVVGWIDVFTRQRYQDILLDSLRYCQEHKGLRLNCWCVMSNHVRLIGSAKDKNLSEVLRDFKKFTSRQIIQAIESNPAESRKEWMLKLFREYGSSNLRNEKYQFWRQNNHPIELYSPRFTTQRIHYTHENPVRAGIVLKAEDYLYSSARDYKQSDHVGLLKVSFL